VQNGQVGTMRVVAAATPPGIFDEPAQGEQRVILVGDSPIRVGCFEHLIKARAGDLKVESVISVGRIVKAPDLVLLDVKATTLEPRIEEILREIKLRLGNVPVMLMSDNSDLRFESEALRFGARGIVSTAFAGDIVIAALRLVLAGGTFVSPGLVAQRHARSEERTTEQSRRSRCLAQLTPRELEIIEQVRTGRPNKIIAYMLNMSESTVKTHLRNIMRKAKTTNRTELALLVEGVSQQ
jgi:DNA-binding NarL/FixJ family response regulator